MAIMHPRNLAEYMPTKSERKVYYLLKDGLPDDYEVFYSVQWSRTINGRQEKSEADFIVTNPEYGYLCLEVKGGDSIRIEDDIWYLYDSGHGERVLKESPYNQAEKSMYYFRDLFSDRCHTKYTGFFGAGVVFPFYAIDDDLNLDNRERDCTIDCNDLHDIHTKIKKLFRIYAGKKFGRNYYNPQHHAAFLDLIRNKIAVSAAAGSLIEYKEQQLNVINRVQDNYVYFLTNVRQFYIRGGAGTGKTWIAMKIAKSEAQKTPGSVLFVCASPTLAKKVAAHIGDCVDVYDIHTLFSEISTSISDYVPPLYAGVSQSIRGDCKKYSAIFVDEAQDFTEEWARIIRILLVDPTDSRLGIFYDDVQVLREESFGDGFGIPTLPYLLRENIRNTQNIYQWAAENTKLGNDVIANPIEGPTPVTERIREKTDLTRRLEELFREYLIDEHLPSTSLTILVEDAKSFHALFPNGIARWVFVPEFSGDTSDREIFVSSVEDFKGLESDMVIYIHSEQTPQNVNYIAYTRAKYYLIELLLGEI